MIELLFLSWWNKFANVLYKNIRKMCRIETSSVFRQQHLLVGKVNTNSTAIIYLFARVESDTACDSIVLFREKMI